MKTITHLLISALAQPRVFSVFQYKKGRGVSPSSAGAMSHVASIIRPVTCSRSSSLRPPGFSHPHLLTWAIWSTKGILTLETCKLYRKRQNITRYRKCFMDRNNKLGRAKTFFARSNWTTPRAGAYNNCFAL